MSISSLPGHSLRLFVVPAAAFLLIGLAACASTGSGSSRGKGDTISEEEVSRWAPSFSNAYQMVDQLRPQWLVKRGTVSLTPESGMVDYIVVYEDRNRLGDPEALRAIPAQNIRSIQRFSAGEAIPFGPPDHPHGAIVVWTKAGQ